MYPTLRMEAKYHIHLGGCLIKELFQRIVGLCEWASKADLTQAKGEHPKGDKIILLRG